MSDENATPSDVAARAPLGWLRSIIIGIAGLFYAYAVWNSVSYVVSMAQLGLNAYGWFVLLFAVLFPMLIFAVAFALTRRRSAGELTVVMLAGLGVVAVFWMNVVAFSTLNFSVLSV